MTVAPADTVTFLLTPLREGRRLRLAHFRPQNLHFYSRPCGRGDENVQHKIRIHHDFYSRPCGRGDCASRPSTTSAPRFLLTPLREGRQMLMFVPNGSMLFLLTPLREGRRLSRKVESFQKDYFYSRPCGRGDASKTCTVSCVFVFLLTPLREGRLARDHGKKVLLVISTHAPAGGATRSRRRCRTPLAHFYSRPCGRGDMVDAVNQLQNDLFLLTPLREGRPSVTRQAIRVKENFYSRPCGRGDDFVVTTKQKGAISTHAPAGGATRKPRCNRPGALYFYSRPCGRGDRTDPQSGH